MPMPKIFTKVFELPSEKELSLRTSGRSYWPLMDQANKVQKEASIQHQKLLKIYQGGVFAKLNGSLSKPGSSESQSLVSSAYDCANFRFVDQTNKFQPVNTSRPVISNLRPATAGKNRPLGSLRIFYLSRPGSANYQQQNSRRYGSFTLAGAALPASDRMSHEPLRQGAERNLCSEFVLGCPQNGKEPFSTSKNDSSVECVELLPAGARRQSGFGSAITVQPRTNSAAPYIYEECEQLVPKSVRPRRASSARPESIINRTFRSLSFDRRPTAPSARGFQRQDADQNETLQNRTPPVGISRQFQDVGHRSRSSSITASQPYSIAQWKKALTQQVKQNAVNSNSEQVALLSVTPITFQLPKTARTGSYPRICRTKSSEIPFDSRESREARLQMLTKAYMSVRRPQDLPGKMKDLKTALKDDSRTTHTGHFNPIDKANLDIKNSSTIDCSPVIQKSGTGKVEQSSPDKSEISSYRSDDSAECQQAWGESELKGTKLGENTQKTTSEQRYKPQGEKSQQPQKQQPQHSGGQLKISEQQQRQAQDQRQPKDKQHLQCQQPGEKQLQQPPEPRLHELQRREWEQNRQQPEIRPLDQPHGQAQEKHQYGEHHEDQGQPQVQKEEHGQEERCKEHEFQENCVQQQVLQRQRATPVEPQQKKNQAWEQKPQIPGNYPMTRYIMEQILLEQTSEGLDAKQTLTSPETVEVSCMEVSTTKKPTVSKAQVSERGIKEDVLHELSEKPPVMASKDKEKVKFDEDEGSDFEEMVSLDEVRANTKQEPKKPLSGGEQDSSQPSSAIGLAEKNNVAWERCSYKQETGRADQGHFNATEAVPNDYSRTKHEVPGEIMVLSRTGQKPKVRNCEKNSAQSFNSLGVSGDQMIKDMNPKEAMNSEQDRSAKETFVNPLKSDYQASLVHAITNTVSISPRQNAVSLPIKSILKRPAFLTRSNSFAVSSNTAPLRGDSELLRASPRMENFRPFMSVSSKALTGPPGTAAFPRKSDCHRSSKELDQTACSRRSSVRFDMRHNSVFEFHSSDVIRSSSPSEQI
ncbi:unnamed protein product [Calicophoron daubneyi]|uniref:Uncharacterized protein n=1 Tax=Calicophoron daubneyi TaxID=300641 RepID=A0AAV2TDW1_CALDB